MTLVEAAMVFEGEIGDPPMTFSIALAADRLSPRLTSVELPSFRR